MTIAAAFICLDGIVLAADSEYTYNFSKYEGEKLFQFGNDSWAIGIAAAGTMDLAKMFVSDLHRELQAETSVKALHVAIILRAKHFYDEYVRKNGEQDRQLLLLIAVQSKTSDENLLLKVNGDIVDPINQCEFIGTGDELARATASWIYHPHLPMDVATPVALNVLYWTAQHAQFCGQSIHALKIPKPYRQINSFTLYQLKDFFFGLNELLRPIILGCLNARLSEDDFATSMQAFVEKMKLVRRDALRAAAPFPSHLLPNAEVSPARPVEPDSSPGCDAQTQS